MKLLLKSLKSDDGYSLGIVMIFIMGIGTVLGSVLSVSQFSADSQGRGVGQLKISNQLSKASADIIYALNVSAADIASASTQSGAPNCGLPSETSRVTVSCRIAAQGDAQTPRLEEVTFTASNGVSRKKLFSIYPASASSEAPHVSQSGD